jgi:hypothetical protein
MLITTFNPPVRALLVTKTTACIALIIFIGVNVKMHKKASLLLDTGYYLSPNNLHHAHHGVLGTDSPSFLEKAIDACDAAKNEHGEYPSTMYKKIVEERILRWHDEDHKYNFLQMINCKLGGYIYATKLGVRTPRVLFCGIAKDIPTNLNLFGDKYVIKPLRGYSSRGVKVVKDGVDVLHKKPANFETLTKNYDGDEEETMVEELVESVDPNYDGLTPPDHKFFVYEGGVPEIMLFYDRQHKCTNFFGVSSEKWRFLKDFDMMSNPHCPQEAYDAPELKDTSTSRHKALKDAALILASNAGPNWIRVDLFDSKHGPVLGEFTPFSSKGIGGGPDSLYSCVMSYLFIAHAEHGAPNDDMDLLHNATKNELVKFKGMLKMKNELTATPINNTFDFYPPHAREWLQLDEMTKCKKVMETQLEFNSKHK